MVEARPFDFSKDYVTLEQWWRDHGSYAPMQDHLPPTGVIVETDGKPACAGFLYKTDALICVIEFITCDPGLNKQLRDSTLSYLIKTLRDLALGLGYTAIYNSTGIPKLIGRLKDAGFVEADKNQTHMFYFAYETEDGGS